MSRRRVLSGLGAATVSGLAGCSGGDGGGDDGSDSEENEGSGDDTTAGDDNGGTGSSDGDTGDDDDGGEPGGDGATEGGIGSELQGNLVTFAVEYVEPIDTVIEYEQLPVSENDDPYAIPMTVDDYVEQGFATEGSELYAVGIAVKNATDDLLDVSTTLINGDEGPARGPLTGRSQERSLIPANRDSSRYAAPGELQRGELTFAFTGDVSTYTLTFEPFVPGSDERERLTVDFGSGTEATASFTQDPPTESIGESATVGDFDVTMHSIERVASIDDAQSDRAFGPRDEFDYLEIVFDATRVDAAMENSQYWTFGMTDDDGRAFWWHTIYDDATDFNRPLLETLEVGDTAEDYVLGFPVEKDFDPTFLAMEAIGPFEDDSRGEHGRMYRSLWPL